MQKNRLWANEEWYFLLRDRPAGPSLKMLRARCSHFLDVIEPPEVPLSSHRPVGCALSVFCLIQGHHRSMICTERGR